MSRKQKLELRWIGKDDRSRLEPRIFIEQRESNHHSQARSPADQFDNRLIQGDNLLALKALEQEFTGKVKCIYIDPPYNTGAAFEHYEDGLEHSIWLSMMQERLFLLRQLLSEDGSIWISIDDNECHYLKILCDEIFGRFNFVASIIWQKVYTTKNSARHFSDMHDYILVYAKNKNIWGRNLLPRTEALDATYTNPDNDPRGAWATNAIQSRNYYSLGDYEIKSPSGRVFLPPAGTYWRVSKENFESLDRDGRVWWGANGNNTPRIKKFLFEAKQGVVPSTFWPHTEAGHNAEAKDEVRRFSVDAGTEVFSTPKPERLLKRILELASKPGDLVLDSFSGSGTTGAVAHKMGRRWIMVELGDHATTHIVPRLRKVVDGTDLGGITEAVQWKGGGGFRFYRLAPSLLERDKWGNWVVSKEYNPEMLAEAMCKHMGFTYAPSQDGAEYWNHGLSSERDFIYVTTQAITHGMMAALSNDVGPDRHLLICCKAYSGNPAAFENLTVRKIPQAVLANCEWGRDDYSLRVAALPVVEPTAADADGLISGETQPTTGQRGRKRKVSTLSGAPSLFDAPATAGK